MRSITKYNEWSGEDIIPWHVNVETVYGCNSSCNMCIVNKKIKRKKGVMEEKLYRKIVDAVSEFRNEIKKFDFIGLGEPLLDPNVAERILYAKKKGINGVAIATNADLLTRDKAAAILEAGVDTVIFSIDGINAETHEAIRRGTVFKRVVDNANTIVRLRDQGGYHTKFVFRFIRQESNWDEWDGFEDYWKKRTMPGRDLVMCYGQHNWGGYLCPKSNLISDTEVRSTIDRSPCHWVFDMLTVRKDGNVVLCGEDALDPQYNFGDLNKIEPLHAFNCKEFKDVRKLNVEGRKCEIEMCRECTVPYSEAGRFISK